MHSHSAAERAAIAASHRRIQFAFTVSFVFVAVLWWIRLIEWLGGWHWSRLGVQPHVIGGLIGIVTAPLLHVSWEHLLANTLPVLILGTALLYGYPKASRLVVPLVWLGTGVGVWFTGPPGYHLGASGLVMGFIAFLIVPGA
ncbi:MAG: rhomboid family intramembrane serine protease, partial [Nitrococcus sp.]|nr:rhomboid family intramembrane serine protease [Nitrococcus sp.]